MFSGTYQPSLISLFSSTSSDPTALYSTHTDPALPSDSFIHFLHDDSSLPPPEQARTLISDDQDGLRNLDQIVLHIQSPTLPATYIRCPPAQWSKNRDLESRHSRRAGDLGIKHPWIHLQVKNLGREWSFEVGVVDHAGREGIIRCSTFQKQPRLTFSRCSILHLPLSFPSASSHPLTAWSTIHINLPSLLPYFSSASLVVRNEDEDGSILEPSHPPVHVPSGSLLHVSHVKVYATCRLRRIWFSELGPDQQLPWEFQLYSIPSRI